MNLFFKTLSLGLVILAAIAFWLWNRGSFSKEVVKLEVLGPESVRFGEEVSYLVKIKNNGAINLEEAKLVFEYPEQSFSPLTNQSREELGAETIYPGQERTLTFETRLFGSEGDKKVARAFLRYKPKGLKSTFESETSKTTVISSVPFTFDIDIPSKIETSKELRFSLNYFSNIDYPLQDLRLVVEYPADFEFISSSPISLEKNEWKIPLLNHTEGGRVEIMGKFRGQIGENRIIKARAGVWQGNSFILLKELTKGIALVRPSLFISAQINGNPHYLANPGELLHYEIIFKNIGQEPITDLFMVVKLEGRAFDFHTTKTLQGTFTSGDNSIIFDSRQVGDLKFLDAQKEGKVEFWIELKKEWSLLSANDKNHSVKAAILLGQAREIFVTKINSKLALSQKGFYSDSSFTNTGSYPPKVGQPTTFTVSWEAKNFYNDVSDIKVKAVLPSQVRLTGKFVPENAKLTFDSVSRELVWDVGNMTAGQGVLNEAPKVAFQIELLPSESQKDQLAILVNEATITGLDDWTNQEISAKAAAIDTNLPDDPTITDRRGPVE